MSEARRPPHPSRLLDGLSGHARRTVVDRARRRSLAQGEVLFQQDEPAEALFLVEAGRLKLTQLTTDGRELIVRIVGPGEVFAAMAVLDGKTYPFSATAVEESRVMAWSRSLLPGLFQEHPQLQANLLQVVGAHARETMDRFRELATEPVPQRLARALLRLLPLGDECCADGIFLAGITQEQLADIAATTLYTGSRVLSQWENEGLLTAGRGKIRIRSRSRLSELAEAPAGALSR